MFSLKKISQSLYFRYKLLIINMPRHIRNTLMRLSESFARPFFRIDFSYSRYFIMLIMSKLIIFMSYIPEACL